MKYFIIQTDPVACPEYVGIFLNVALTDAGFELGLLPVRAWHNTVIGNRLSASFPSDRKRDVLLALDIANVSLNLGYTISPDREGDFKTILEDTKKLLTGGFLFYGKFGRARKHPLGTDLDPSS